MWHRIFTTLPLAFLPSIFLLPIGRTTVSHDIFASAVGAMNSGDDHGICCLSNDFCPYFITTFPFPPLPNTHRLQQRKQRACDRAVSRQEAAAARLVRAWWFWLSSRQKSPLPSSPPPSSLPTFLPLPPPLCLVLVARLLLIPGNGALLAVLSSPQKIDAHPTTSSGLRVVMINAMLEKSSLSYLDDRR